MANNELNVTTGILDFPLTTVGARGDTLEIGKWTTPLTRYHDMTMGAARLTTTVYEPGLYPLEGIDGYLFYHLKHATKVRELQRRTVEGAWSTWMLDNPLHVMAMADIVRRIPPGRVLCAGLGLGLMTHQLAARPDIEEIRVVEIAADVIELMRPTLPRTERLHVSCADFYDFIKSAAAARYDSVLWDLAVGTAAETANDFCTGYALCGMYLRQARLFQFGVRGGADNYFDVDEAAARRAREVHAVYRALGIVED